MTVMFLFLLEEEDCQLNKGTERVRGGSESPLTHVHTHTHAHAPTQLRSMEIPLFHEQFTVHSGMSLYGQ